MSTVNPTQPLAELRNPQRKTCHQIGICQHPSKICDKRCEIATGEIKMPKPTTLPTLDPGVLDGPYSHKERLRREHLRNVKVWFTVVLGCMVFWGVVAYVSL